LLRPLFLVESSSVSRYVSLRSWLETVTVFAENVEKTYKVEARNVGAGHGDPN
jgi:hypothetical protein